MFEAEVSAFCEMQTSPRTRTEYRKDLARWFGAGLPLTVDGVAEYKRYLESSFKESTAGRFWSTARSFHRWLVNRGLLTNSPFEVVKAPVRRRNPVVNAPSDNNVDALVASCEPGRDKAVVMLLLSGLRASEVTTLRTDSIHFDNGYGYWLQVLGKGNKERIVPISDEVVAALNELPNDGSDWLVPNHDGSQLTYDTVNNLVDKASAKAGVKIYPHMLRHHYATRLIRNGVNVITLSKLLGHASVSTTERYVSMDLSDLVTASRLDPRANGGIHLVSEDLEVSTGTRADAGHRHSLRVASA